jgi:hypothetical protein
MKTRKLSFQEMKAIIIELRKNDYEEPVWMNCPACGGKWEDDEEPHVCQCERCWGTRVVLLESYDVDPIPVALRHIETRMQWDEFHGFHPSKQLPWTKDEALAIVLGKNRKDMVSA